MLLGLEELFGAALLQDRAICGRRRRRPGGDLRVKIPIKRPTARASTTRMVRNGGSAGAIVGAVGAALLGGLDDLVEKGAHGVHHPCR